jgi:hypothetical protein
MRQFYVKGTWARESAKVRKNVAIHEMGIDELHAFKRSVQHNWHSLEGRKELWAAIKKRERALHGTSSYSMRGSEMAGYLERRREADAKARGHWV